MARDIGGWRSTPSLRFPTRQVLILISLLFLEACANFGPPKPLPPKIDYTDLKVKTVSWSDSRSNVAYWTEEPDWGPEEEPQRYEDGTCCCV